MDIWKYITEQSKHKSASGLNNTSSILTIMLQELSCTVQTTFLGPVKTMNVLRIELAL